MNGYEVRKVISERSESLQSFVAPLERDIRTSAKYRGCSRGAIAVAVSKVAELVLNIVRRIAHRETGIFALDPNVSLLLSTLICASRVGRPCRYLDGRA